MGGPPHRERQTTLWDTREVPGAGVPASFARDPARLLTLVDALDVIVWEADARTWSFVFVSKRAEDILGYPLAQWLSEPDFWVSHLDPEDRDQAVALCQAATREGRDHALEYRMVAADGRRVWIHELVRVERDPAGEPSRLYGVMLDITDRKRAEEALRETYDRLRKADDQRRQLLIRLVEAQEEERRRVAVDIHDDTLQTLAAVAMRLGTLRRGLRDPEQESALARLEQTVQLAMARLRHLLFDLRPPPLDRGDLAGALAEHLARLREDAGVDGELEDRLGRALPPEVLVTAYRIAREALANWGATPGPARSG
ncbi:MAG TPA: PAS domain-containing protein [Actinomycetota bacterium]|nr:PAS domain-containing protein [Actinomycetota bacterium]